MIGKIFPPNIGHRKTQRQGRIFFGSTVLLFFFSLTQTDFDFSYAIKGMDKTRKIIGELFQPDMAAVIPYLEGLWQTLAIAMLGLGFSVILAVGLVFFTASNTTPNPLVSKVIKVIMVFIRAIPITIWALIAAASVGFGSLAGLLGLLFPTTSYLVRILSERVEESGGGTIEAMNACGATWLEMCFKGILVELFPQFLATIALRYELSVSESVVLGMVGVAGIGYRLNMSIGTYNFRVASTGIIIVYVTMLCLEIISKKIVTVIKGEGK